MIKKFFTNNFPKEPEILSLLKDREMRIENRINRFRFVFLFILYNLDLYNILSVNNFPTEQLIVEIAMYILTFLGLYRLHKITSRKKYYPSLKYFTVFLDLGITFGYFLMSFGNIEETYHIAKGEFVITMSLFYIFFNTLSVLRSNKNVIIFSSMLALLMNLYPFLLEGVNTTTIYYSTFVILSQSFFNLWVSDIIVQNVVSNHRLNKAFEEIKIYNTEILQQKEEIATQRDLLEEANSQLNQQNEEITAQRDEIEVARQLIEEKNRNIIDSIRYAQRIQQAILPSEEKMKHLLKDYFVLFRPKDIVSGDFYWVEETTRHVVENVEKTKPDGTTDFIRKKRTDIIILFSAIDCTGHGVPGAFMSLMGYNGLTQAIKENELSKPEGILDFLGKFINTMLRKKQDDSQVKDGMDLCLCAYNTRTQVLEWAGVHNPGYIVRGGEVIAMKPDTHPIGEPYTEDFTQYTHNEVQLHHGDNIYLLSDGYVDQFGGPKRKKFMSKRFKDLLVEIQPLSMAEQQQKLNSIFEDWKGELEQYDDVLVLGLRI